MKRIICVFLTFSVLFFTASCSSDSPISEGSEPGSGVSPTQALTIRTLQSSKWYVEDGGDFSFGSDYVDYDEQQLTLFFISDEEGVSRLHYRHYSTDADNSAGVKALPFVYEVRDDGEIDIVFENGEKDKLRLNGKNMLKSETYNTEYESRTITSDDRTWIQKNRKPKGTCGENVTWVFNRSQSTLYIDGSGKMTDYASEQQPWASIGNEVQHLIIDGKIERIGNNAFSCCPFLKDCEYWNPSGGSIKQIGREAFAGTALSVISLPSSVESVESGAFYGCKNVSKVYMTDLDDKLEVIGDDAFHFSYTTDYLNIAPNVKEIGQRAFMGWTIRKQLKLNETLENIGHYAFSKVGGKIVIPNSVKSIGSFAFCGGFSEVVIGSGVESIAENAFDGTTRYSSTNIVSVNLGKPLELNGSIMANDNSNLWNLRVPKGSKDAYAKSKYWKQFRSITEDATLVSGNGFPESGGEDSGSGETKPVTGVTQGHEWVDLGLPSGTKWATMNVGASKCSDAGNYYMFAQKNPDVTGHPNATKKLPDCTGVEKNYFIAGNAEYDLARIIWGSSWKMPLQEQVQELEANCTASWHTENGVAGVLFTSKKNGGTLFFPVTGFKTTENDNLPYQIENSIDGYFWLGQYFASKNYIGGTYEWVYGAYCFRNKMTNLFPTSFSTHTWHNDKLPVRAVTK